MTFYGYFVKNFVILQTNLTYNIQVLKETSELHFNGQIYFIIIVFVYKRPSQIKPNTPHIDIGKCLELILIKPFHSTF